MPLSPLPLPAAPPKPPPAQRGRGVTAVLGPTNTGKTHLAIERLIGHGAGMIGLPLRLLAREVYGKLVARVGEKAVALVTGEEKIKPPEARYWVSTVEAMPQDLDVPFMAIDEIQIAADLERGHTFTDRLLNRRGRDETLVLGAATMRPLVEKLLPGVHVVTRPRLSNLTFAGERKLTRLQRRSAVVAFSAKEVYEIAELIRRQRGGAAVVLGALSPRTRNAQVDLYQSGDVDYLVATDAIGMGLNLDVDHVAFAGLRKFDGFQFRDLNPAELAQIAGRAGRASRDGTFGTTGRCPPLDEEVVQRIEAHEFDAHQVLQWRNSDLDFHSLRALSDSLDRLPGQPGLTRAPMAEDQRALEIAGRDADVRARATGAATVERLWETCQVPDYRKISPAAHAEMVIELYRWVAAGRIPSDWFARRVRECENREGDLDTLMQRIAHVRTWTFVANRPDWLDDPEHWQGVTRQVEDRLSDALHERLAQRFVDRRTSVLMRRLRENAIMETEITKTGDVIVEGHTIGRLEGFQFAPDGAAGGADGKALRAAAAKALVGEIEARAAKLNLAGDDTLLLTHEGVIRWNGEAVARIVAGEEVHAPRVRILSDEQLTGAARDLVQARLDLWIKAHVDRHLSLLLALGRAEEITGIGRGIAYQLQESLGVLDRARVANDMKTLDQAGRATMRKYGVKFGAYHIYLPLLLKPKPRELAGQLWLLKHGGTDVEGLDALRGLAASGRTSVPVDKTVPRDLYRTLGYRVAGERAVRVDILERLADLIRPALGWRPNQPGPRPPGAVDGSSFSVTGQMTSLVGCSGEDFASILKALGYRNEMRPKPPEPETPAEAPAAAPAGDAAEAGSEADAPDPAEAADAGAPPDAAAEAATEGAVEPAEAAPPAPEPAAKAPAEPVAEAAPAAEGAEPVAADAAPAEPATPAEPEMIEVWRPGRPEGQRHEHHRPRQPRGGAEGDGPRPPRGERREGGFGGRRDGAPGERRDAPAGGERRDGPPGERRADGPRGERRFGDRPGGGEFRRGPRPPQGTSADGATPQAAAQLPDRPAPDRPAPDRGPRPDRGPPQGGRPGGGDRPQGDRGPRRDKRPDQQEWRQFNADQQRERGNKPERKADPDSPFAKLAALKEQLEQNQKRKD